MADEVNGHAKSKYVIIELQHTQSMVNVLAILRDYQQQIEQPVTFGTSNLGGYNHFRGDIWVALFCRLPAVTLTFPPFIFVLL